MCQRSMSSQCHILLVTPAPLVMTNQRSESGQFDQSEAETECWWSHEACQGLMFPLLHVYNNVTSLGPLANVRSVICYHVGAVCVICLRNESLIVFHNKMKC